MGASDILGSKLGPRLAELLAKTLTAHKSASLDSDVEVRHQASWKTLTGLGYEFGDLTRLVLEPVINVKGELPPGMAQALDIATSGSHQGYSIGMGTAIGMALSPLSTIFSNYLAGAIYAAVGADPKLIPTLDQIIGLTVRRQLTEAQMTHYGGQLGFDESWVHRLYESSFNIPGPAELAVMHRRGLISLDNQAQLLRNSGFPELALNAFLSLNRVLLSPADAALAVLRGNLSHQQGVDLAEAAGIQPEDFDVIIGNTGEPPGLAELLLLWRRGQITTDRLDQGIRQSRVRDEWIDDVHKLSILPPSQAEAITAVVESQTDRETAFKRFREAGGDPDWFDIAVGITGAAPSPVELGTLANRGIIPWEGTGKDVTTFEQGVFEGRSKNKWLEAWRQLAVYLPPPRTVVAIVKQGAIDKATALDLLQKQGLSHELATAYVNGATAEKLATHKQLSVSLIESLYEERGIDRETASAMLNNEGYDQTEANYILWLSDFKVYKKGFDLALGKVQSAYVGRKIDKNTASNLLDELQVPSEQRDTLLVLWTFAQEANIKTLTPAEIRSAVKKSVITSDDAMLRLTEQGYSETDAQIFLAL